MATRMQQRRGTAAQWAAANPVLADGEIGFEKDTGVIRFGNGTSTWNQLPAALGNTFLPVGGKAYDSDRLDGLDSTAFAQKAYVDGLVLPAGASRQLMTHFGTVAAFPTTGIRIGDRCYRSDLFCEFYYTGSVWRQTKRAEMSSAQRAALSTTSKADLYVGYEMFENDTFFDRRWDGGLWEIEQWHGNRAGVSGSGATGLTSAPAMSLQWPNVSLASNSNLNPTNWTNVYSPGTQFANAGDGPGGPALFTYVNQPSGVVRCNAKGRVQADIYAISDSSSVGQSFISLGATGADSMLSGISDRRHRGTGYAGSGLLDQWVSKTMYVYPGDLFGALLYQLNSSSAALLYNVYLQLKYI